MLPKLSLIEIFRILRKGNTPTEIDWRNIFSSVWHKSEKLPITQIDGLAQEIAKATTNFKGYHTDETALKKAYPKAENKKDFFAWVGVSPTFIWKVDANGGDWRNTGDEPTQQEIDLSGYAKQTDIDKLEKTIENIPTEAIIDINSEVTRGGKYLFFGQGHPESNVIDMYEDILTVDNTYIVQSGSTGSGNLYKSSVHIPLFSTDGRIRFYGFGSSSSARALAFYTETNQVVKVVENINSDFGILQEVEIPQGAHNFIICKHKDHPFMCSILLGESDQIVNEKDEWSIVEVSKGVATKADSIIKPNIFLATKTIKPRKTISYLVEKGEYPNFGYRGTRYGNEILTMAGYLDRGNGSFRENSSYKSSDFMPIRDYEDFIYTPIASETACAIAFYKDGSFLYSDKHGDSSSVRPSNATHFRICGRTDQDYFIIIKHPLGELTSLSIVEPSIVSFVNGDWAVRPLSNSNKSKPASNFVPRVICKLEDFKHPTIENGKINIVGNNSPNPKQILLDVDTYIERLCMRTTFSMSSDDSKVIIGKGGSRMEIDTFSKKIRFYQMTNSLGCI